MTIALDATYSLGEDLSGVGIYSRELLLGLAEEHPDARFDWFYRPHRYLRAWGAMAPPNIRRRLLASGVPRRRAALFHGLNQRLPRLRTRRSVATFHDLFVLTGDYSTKEFRARFAGQAQDAAGRADLIVAVSAFTASQVVEHLKVEPSRVRVVHHGIRELACPPVPREKIILNVGAIQFRKNIGRLVEAFASMSSEWRLVLAGSSGYGSAEILRAIEASPARERIQVTGYVSNDELAAWYSRAMIFAFPSLDEGFGMPVLEAMAAGVPVLTSNCSALPEVAGGAALLVDPTDIDAIAHGLRELTQKEQLRNELAAKGRDRAKQFSWDKAVRETWEIYASLLN